VTSVPPHTDHPERRRLLASPRFRIALTLLLLNVLLGWPAVLLLGSLSVWMGARWLGLLGGLLMYAVSWVMLGVAMLLGGREVLVHGRWLVRRWLKKRQGR
jgi:predicted phage tail protein